MIQLQSKEEYLEIRNRFNSKNKEYDTNCYYSLEKVEELVRDDRLYYEITDTQLLLYQKDSEYYVLNYYIAKNIPLNIECNEPLLVELIGNSKVYDLKREQELINNGFVLHDKNIQMIMKKKQIEDVIDKGHFAEAFAKRNGIYFEYATQKDMDELYTIWKTYINPYAIKEISTDERMAMFEHKRCVIARNQDKEILATNMYSLNGKVATFSHTVVLPKYRMTGLAVAVRGLCMQNAIKEGVEKGISWIATYNHKSMSMVSHHAVSSGKFSQQLIRRK